MNTTAIANTLATLAESAKHNCRLMDEYRSARSAAHFAGTAEPSAPSWIVRKTDTMKMNGHTILAVAALADCRTIRSSFRPTSNYYSVRWHLDGKAVSRANLVKILEGAE